jgi:1,2-dihydroxy-3,5-cyclohexadiene-1,4-dicarboxylate dehydrogenase
LSHIKPRIAIATGDPAGIGPEIATKAARLVRGLCEPVLVDSGIAKKDVRVGKVAAAHGRAALEAAEIAIRGALAGEYHAVVAAPHTQASIDAAGLEFDGYPSFVARTCGLAPEAGILMLCFPWRKREIRIAHVTLHASVPRAVASLSRDAVKRTVGAVKDALQRIGVRKPRIAVSGLNPHAAGPEEARIIGPAIAAIADGPFGADTLLQREGYDAYVVMLHDQGHVAAKLLAPNGAAALTIGTPVLFSSVAHGSALDIAGEGRADPTAMVEAITRLVGRRRRARATY